MLYQCLCTRYWEGRKSAKEQKFSVRYNILKVGLKYRFRCERVLVCERECVVTLTDVNDALLGQIPQELIHHGIAITVELVLRDPPVEALQRSQVLPVTHIITLTFTTGISYSFLVKYSLDSA